MVDSDRQTGLAANRFLEAVSTVESQRLTRSLESVLVPIRTVLFEARQTTNFVHFPLTCVISLVTPFKHGASVEVATVGNEGIVGVPMVLGGSLTVRAVVSVGGWIGRVPAATFLTEVHGDADLREGLDDYLRGLFGQIAQATACNRLHSNEARLSKWLLTSHDRVGTVEFAMSLEFLGQMLGSRRATVARTVNTLQSAGLIRHRPGHVELVDIPGLDAIACECYATLKARLAEIGRTTRRIDGTTGNA